MVDRNGLADNCIFKHVRFRGLSFAGHTSYDYTSAFELRYSRNFRKFAGIAAGGDVLRYMMYYNSYSDHERAKELFANLPRLFAVVSKTLTTPWLRKIVLRV